MAGRYRITMIYEDGEKFGLEKQYKSGEWVLMAKKEHEEDCMEPLGRLLDKDGVFGAARAQVLMTI